MNLVPASQVAPGDIGPSRVIKKLAPQQSGAQRWARLYGEQLVCVRYRDCGARGERLVTVELVVDRKPAPTPGDTPVGVRIERDELDLRQRAKSAGAEFDWHRRLWVMPLRVARGLGLRKRIVEGPGQDVAIRGKG